VTHERVDAARGASETTRHDAGSSRRSTARAANNGQQCVAPPTCRCMAAPRNRQQFAAIRLFISHSLPISSIIASCLPLPLTILFLTPIRMKDDLTHSHQPIHSPSLLSVFGVSYRYLRSPLRFLKIVQTGESGRGGKHAALVPLFNACGRNKLLF